VTVLLWRLQGRVEVDEMEFGGSLGGVARLTISYVIASHSLCRTEPIIQNSEVCLSQVFDIIYKATLFTSHVSFK